MLGLDEVYREYLNVAGSLLKLPEYTLTPGKEYAVEAVLLGYNNSQELAKDSLSIKVAKRPILAAIFPSSVEIGPERSITFEVVLANFNVNEEIQIDWKCTDEKGGKCEGGIVKKLTKFDIDFKKIGR